MFDIDNKDKTVGLTCPPAVFLEKDFLLKVSALLSTSGIFVLNLVCRDEELKKELMTRIKTVFTSVYYVNIDDEVNDIVYALNQESDAVCPSDKFIKTVQENVGTLNQFIKRNATKKSEINLLDAMEKLKIG
ncbi:hypothetical protein SNE40_001274 [Patella caerulea]|uniref:Uncharacterized protein n=1 Tax=Patella caerulea TaxID=87958 RepID=A0AAN8QAZ7_PATCE